MTPNGTIDSTEVAAIADEFNNILTVIGGYAVLMQEDVRPGDPYEQDLAEINTSLRRAAEITRRLAQLAEEEGALVAA